MPYVKTWQEPELLLEHGGVSVYANYEDDEADRMLSQWVTTDPSPGGGDGPFSLRWDELDVEQSGDRDDVLRRAIDAGLVRVPESPSPRGP